MISSSSRMQLKRLCKCCHSQVNMGFDQDRFASPVNDGLLCCVCRDVLEDPVQAPCEHAFCISCIHGWLVEQNACPEDRRPLDASDLRPLFRYMKNDLDALLIRCRNAPAGCTVICSLESINTHETECEFHALPCPSLGCNVVLECQALEEHLEQCQFRQRLCPHGCGIPMLEADDLHHNCIAELRHATEILRSEMICKVEEQKREAEARVEGLKRDHLAEMDVIKTQMDSMRLTIEELVTSDQRKTEEIQRVKSEKSELTSMLRDFLKQHVINDSRRSSSKLSKKATMT